MLWVCDYVQGGNDCHLLLQYLITDMKVSFLFLKFLLCFSPTALEQFFLEPNNFDLLTQLLMCNGIGKLFVYGKRPELRPFVIEDLNMVPNLINVKVRFSISQILRLKRKHP